jgi:hypothetical protein
MGCCDDKDKIKRAEIKKENISKMLKEMKDKLRKIKK